MADVPKDKNVVAHDHEVSYPVTGSDTERAFGENLLQADVEIERVERVYKYVLLLNCSLRKKWRVNRRLGKLTAGSFQHSGSYTSSAREFALMSVLHRQ